MEENTVQHDSTDLDVHGTALKKHLICIYVIDNMVL